ncbi:hypothetical protein BX616_008533 [Lobosporangium transversale]|nr:hypothetical protein BX616_008533 [Lobosporangium transversale]
MLEGIMHLYNHFLIITLREGVSRPNNCDVAEATEYPMLSSFELKSLLGTVLSGPTPRSNATNMPLRSQASSRVSPPLSTTTEQLQLYK